MIYFFQLLSIFFYKLFSDFCRFLHFSPLIFCSFFSNFFPNLFDFPTKKKSQFFDRSNFLSLFLDFSTLPIFIISIYFIFFSRFSTVSILTIFWLFLLDSRQLKFSQFFFGHFFTIFQTSQFLQLFGNFSSIFRKS